MSTDNDSISNVSPFPNRFPTGPVLTIEEREYLLSDVWETFSALTGVECQPFRYLWAVNLDTNQVVMWRASDGDEKLGGDIALWAGEVREVDNRRQLNLLRDQEFKALDGAMRRRYHETLEALKSCACKLGGEYQRKVDDATRSYFDQRVRPMLDAAISAVEAGAVPIRFRVDSKKIGVPQIELDRVAAVGQVLSSEFTPEIVDVHLMQVGIYDPDGDIQASYWVVNEVIDEVMARLSPCRKER